jgi:hypothetical protein
LTACRRGDVGCSGDGELFSGGDDCGGVDLEVVVAVKLEKKALSKELVAWKNGCSAGGCDVDGGGDDDAGNGGDG